jgi:hypothetical protein
MHTIRRLYFYSVAFITLEVVLWGLISLLRSMFSAGLSGSGDTLAGALSMILVGVPIFALHWLWAQRASAADEEEHTASLRAIFLYGALLATLIPVTQNALALLDRSLISAAGLDTFRAVFGGSQTWVDNLIAILMNSIAAAYFVNVVRRDWATLSDKENFADIRRLYRFIWLLYSLLMVVYGIQQIIRFLLYIPADTLGQNSRDLFINGLSLLLVGVPIWYFSWKTCQDALSQPGEHGSTLRLGLLYLLALSGVAVVLSASGSVVDMFLRWMLGEQMTVAEFVGRISGTLATALPLGAVWAYYGHWLHHDIRATADEGRRDELRRFYFYILSLAGLVTAFVGTALLVSFILDVVVGRQIWGDDLRLRVSAALAALIVGLPLWLATWRPMQAQALSQDSAGGSARQSVVRKTYLYLALFASVIGGMVSAVYVFYRLLQAALGTQSLDVTALLNSLQLLALFIVVLVYHLSCLRADGSESARARIERREKFAALVFEVAGSGFGESIRLSAQKQASGLPLTVLPWDAEIPKEAASAKAAILPSDAALNPPDNLRKFLAAFDGQIIVVPVEHPRLMWVGGTGRKSSEQAALALRQLSEGQEMRQAGGTPAWMVVVYVFAALFGLELLMLLLSLGISLIVN